ncbi:hypothetical protein B0O99DRAFT_691791 [Bisporella sp. PMI_857]|nr:hypothetical protein B0O99DRAFT_691791 [Bisporella sp. PMI_857]
MCFFVTVAITALACTSQVSADFKTYTAIFKTEAKITRFESTVIAPATNKSRNGIKRAETFTSPLKDGGPALLSQRRSGIPGVWAQALVFPGTNQLSTHGYNGMTSLAPAIQ